MRSKAELEQHMNADFALLILAAIVAMTGEYLEAPIVAVVGALALLPTLAHGVYTQHRYRKRFPDASTLPRHTS